MLLQMALGNTEISASCKFSSKLVVIVKSPVKGARASGLSTMRCMEKTDTNKVTETNLKRAKNNLKTANLAIEREGDAYLKASEFSCVEACHMYVVTLTGSILDRAKPPRAFSVPAKFAFNGSQGL